MFSVSCEDIVIIYDPAMETEYLFYRRVECDIVYEIILPLPPLAVIVRR